jgi:hypothetical protein
VWKSLTGKMNFFLFLSFLCLITHRALDVKHEHDAIYSMVVPGNVWTIDLAFILKQFGVDFTFYTILAGVNAEYSGVVLLLILHYNLFRN